MHTWRAACMMAAIGLLVTGCSREWPAPPPPQFGASATLTATSASSEGAALQSLAAANLTIEQPIPGATIHSPVQVQGRVNLPAGLILAAQVRSREIVGGLDRPVWRGNGPLKTSSDGTFSGQITYSLASAMPGYLEVAIADPESGTVLGNYRVDVQVSPAP